MSYGTKIHRVESVSLTFDTAFPPRLVVKANGTASTPGWSESKLIPYIYITPPDDGIQDCDFVAKPPPDPVPAVLSPLTAIVTIDAIPDWVVGVRVRAAANRVVQRI